VGREALEGNNVLYGHRFRVTALGGGGEGGAVLPLSKKCCFSLDGWIDAAGVLDAWLLVSWLVGGRGVKVKCRSLAISPGITTSTALLLSMLSMYCTCVCFLKRKSAYVEQPFWKKLASGVSIKCTAHGIL